MARNNPISVETLHQLLRCDAAEGKLYWKQRPREMFPSFKGFRTWEARFADKEAFTSKNRNGYFHGCILYKYLLAHRIIWAMENGQWPDQIDHINHNKTDNRISNLRSVSLLENQHNVRLHKRNTSGTAGVDWNKKDKRWRARICVAGININLGYYKLKTDATLARKAAEIEHGFHPNHGLNLEQ